MKNNSKYPYKVTYNIDDSWPASLNNIIILKPLSKYLDDVSHSKNFHFSVFDNNSNLIYDGTTVVESFEIDFFNKRKSSLFDNGFEINDESNPSQLQYFSLMQSMTNYRKIVQRIGTEEAIRVLIALGDIPTIKEFEITVFRKWFLEAQKRVFSDKNLIRSSEAYYAFYNAASILRNRDVKRFESGKKNFDISFKLENFVAPHRLSFNFAENDILSKRISVIIGENGVGKSQTLKNIFQSDILTKNGNGVVGDERAQISKILAFSTSPKVSDSFRLTNVKNRPTVVKRFSLTNVTYQPLGESNGEILVQLFVSKKTISEVNRFTLFLLALRAINFSEQLAFPKKEKGEFVRFKDFLAVFDTLEEIDIQSKLSMKGKPVRLINEKHYPLSSGELTYLRFALYASLYIENGSLVLFDEPETHLHPSLISQFVGVLTNILEATDSVSIIATHSVYFVREVFRDQVQIMRRTDDDMIVVEKPRLKTFGADVGLISNFVFNDNNDTALAEEVLNKIVLLESKVEHNSPEKIIEKYKSELSEILLIELLKRLVSHYE